MSYRLAVIGEQSSILIYQAFGIEVFGVSRGDEARDVLDDLSRKEDNGKSVYAVVFMEENFYKNLPDDLINRLAKKALPAVIPVPSPNSKDNNFSTNRLRKIVERAVGSDILK